MNEPSAFGYQEDGQLQQVPIPGGQVNPAQYKFSADELRVLGECNRESFFQRSLPLGTLLGLGTWSAVQSGHLRANPRFGAFPKLTLAVVVGYFLGKLSYQSACADKLMALPGSYIGQLLRDRRDGKIGGASQPRQATTMFGASPGDIYSDAGPGSSLDLDTDRPIFSDDTYRPDNEGPSAAPLPPRPALSYDDLRRQNRGQHTDARQDPYKMDQNVLPPITRPAPRPAAPHTNKYGDAME
ncbi:OCIA domain-containing protein 1 isoform X2 [Ostrinia nubilalis]|uniref:OCIA domain-containing protein 1 isoform X2 n=1 Tax=Ostrinia nubilalis TaxID=29057 RepID=UPI0030824EFB